MKIKEIFQGTGQVFRFTLTQLLKSKANIITLILAFLIALASVPVSSIGGSSAEPAEELQIYSYVFDTAEYESYDPEKPFEDDFEEEFFDADEYNAQIGFSIFLMMLCVYSISYIVRAVIEEKSSKLVDLLMVSVKPGALMLGKVLAVLLFVVLYMAVLLGGVLISMTVTPMFMEVGSNAVINALGSMNLSLKGVLVALVTGTIGFFAFGVLAALSGAGCSNMEESGGAMGTCMILIMAGYMASIFVSMISSESVITAFCLLPVLSMFVAPLQYMSGNIGIGIVAASCVIQLAAAALLLFLASRVYKNLIIYNGKRLGIKDMLKMAGGKEALQ